MAIDRAKKIDGGSGFSPIWFADETAAQKDGTRLLRQIEENKNNKWIDKYLVEVRFQGLPGQIVRGALFVESVARLKVLDNIAVGWIEKILQRFLVDFVG